MVGKHSAIRLYSQHPFTLRQTYEVAHAVLEWRLALIQSAGLSLLSSWVIDLHHVPHCLLTSVDLTFLGESSIQVASAAFWLEPLLTGTIIM